MRNFDCAGPCAMCNASLLDDGMDAWEIRDAATRAALGSALACVFPGADSVDADAVLDHLQDIGFRVVAA